MPLPQHDADSDALHVLRLAQSKPTWIKVHKIVQPKSSLLELVDVLIFSYHYDDWFSSLAMVIKPTTLNFNANAIHFILKPPQGNN